MSTLQKKFSLTARILPVVLAFGFGVTSVAEAGKPNHFGAPNRTKIRFDAQRGKKQLRGQTSARWHQAIPSKPNHASRNVRLLDAAASAKLAVDHVFAQKPGKGQLATIGMGLLGNTAEGKAEFSAKLVTKDNKHFTFEMVIVARNTKHGAKDKTKSVTVGLAKVDRKTGKVTRIYGEAAKPQPVFKVTMKQGADAARAVFSQANAPFNGTVTIGTALEQKQNISYSTKSIGKDGKNFYYEVQMSSFKKGKKGKTGKKTGSLVVGYVAVDGQTGQATKLDKKPEL
jgi:hypothetical protein